MAAYMFAGLQAMSREGAMFEMDVELGETQFQKITSYAATIANIAPATSVLSQGLGQVRGPAEGRRSQQIHR